MKDAVEALSEPAVAAGEEEKTEEQSWNEALAEKSSPVEQDVQDETDDDADPDTSSEADETTDDGEEATGQTSEELQAQLERLQHSVKSEKGRHTASQRQISDLRAEIKTLRARPKDDKPQAADEALQRSKEEYGDVVGPLVDELTALRKQTAELSAGDSRRADTLERQVNDMTERETGIFESEHPDGWDVLSQNGPAFRDWVQDQRKELRDIWDANEAAIVNGTGVSVLVAEFKRSLSAASVSEPPDTQTNTPLSTRRSRQMDGARVVQSQARRATVATLPDDATEEQIYQHEARRRAKLRKG